MKKKYLTVCFVLSFFLITGCQTQEGKKDAACESEDVACSFEATEPITISKPYAFDEAIHFFKEGKTGVLYFGFEDCPWCQEAVPILKEVASEFGKEVIYIQTRDTDRNILYTDEQKQEIMPYIDQYMSDNDEGQRTLFVPCVVVVKDGQAIAGHVGTVDGHDAHERQMSRQEQAQLKKVYEEMFEKLSGE